MYYFRLDDASDKMNVEKWNRIETLFDKYSIKPLVGVIPENKDECFQIYEKDENFWKKVKSWEAKGWVIALHGCYHVYTTNDSGINPINNRSEFAGESLETQKEKIKKGIEILEAKNINPKVFFAPAHTFDINTIEALKQVSNIRIISDTIASKPYKRWGITFIPQQSGIVRKMPFKYTTFCYHPNIMEEKDFELLENFIKENIEEIKAFSADEINRKRSILDIILSKIYFIRRRIKNGKM